MGSFDHSILVDVSTNCSVGVIGKAKYIPENDPVKIALPFQVREGKATILCDIDGNGISSYEIEITKLEFDSTLAAGGFGYSVNSGSTDIDGGSVGFIDK